MRNIQSRRRYARVVVDQTQEGMDEIVTWCSKIGLVLSRGKANVLKFYNKKKSKLFTFNIHNRK